MRETKKISKESYNNLSFLPTNSYRILWDDDYCDGPLSGMLEYKDEKFYFFVYDSDFPRTYTVYKLSKEILEKEIYWHNLFKELVGDHCDYHEGRRETLFSEKAHPNWLDFYSKQEEEYDPNEPDLSDPNTAKPFARIEF